MTSYLFLDGGCLRERLRVVKERYCPGSSIEMGWWGISAGYRKVFYYDALPAKRPNQSAEEHEEELSAAKGLHSRLATFDRFRVNEGDTRYRRGRGLEQKKVDVMIAVDMMIHTIRGSMSEAALLTGDADFTPLLNALSNEGMFVTLIHPPHAPEELLAAADSRRRITTLKIYEWLTPQSQSHFGKFPMQEARITSLREGCIQIWSGPVRFSGTDNFTFSGADNSTVDVEILLEVANETFIVSWHLPGQSNQMSLRGGNWKNTRFLALDDYGVHLPEALPPEFAHL